MLPPVLPPPPLSYAYVVDYRPLDACSPPACAYPSRKLYGDARKVQFDGDPGAYVQTGTTSDYEVFFRRGLELRPDETFDFVLPDSEAEREFDVYFAATQGDADWRASVTFSEVQGPSLQPKLTTTQWSGHTEPFRHSTEDNLGQYERFSTHVRIPLPGKGRRLTRVTVRNTGGVKLNVGTPVVMRKVEGRGPRQALYTVFDGVAFHLWHAMFEGRTNDPRTAWLGKAVAQRGIYYPNGESPALASSAFTARFFTGQWWGLQGWAALFGLGGIDEALPPHATSLPVRVSEQGVLTEFVGNNFYTLPAYTLIGFDGGEQTELFEHSEGITRYIERWAVDHPRDDAFLFVWNTQTHIPYPPGRAPEKPPPRPPGLTFAMTNTRVVDEIWRNLVDGIDQIEAQLAAFRKVAPDGERIVWLGSDHSRGITMKFTQRPYRSYNDVAGVGLSHGAAGSVEEMRTPFAIFYDGAGKPPANAPHVVNEPTSTMIAWRALAKHFGITLDLPATSSWSDPIFTPAGPALPWDDRVRVSAGIVGVLRAVKDDLAYAYFSPKLQARQPLWVLPAEQQRVMNGSPLRTENGRGIVAEELYDVAQDPYEHKNLVVERFGDVLSMRRNLVDFVSTHFEPPDHPRYAYTLVLPEAQKIAITAPAPFMVVVNDSVVESGPGRRVVIEAASFDIIETDTRIGLAEIAFLDKPASFLVRCAAGGLPFDIPTPGATGASRVNLLLGATNCPTPATGREVARPGEILFSAKPAPKRKETVRGGAAPVAQGRVSADEMLTGMKKWGYVRDIDEGKK